MLTLKHQGMAAAAVRWCFAVLIAVFTLSRMQLLSDSGPLVQIGDEWLYFKGTNEPPGAAMEWTRPAYNRLEAWSRSASAFGGAVWLEGRSGFVTETEPLADRPGRYGTVYFRKELVVADPAAIRWLVLRLDYREGFAAFINGRECLRKNLPATSGPHVPYSTPALKRTDAGAVEFNLGSGLQWLKKGTNFLAIEVHSDRMPPEVAGDGGSTDGDGDGDGDGELLLVPELLANFVRGPMVQSVTSESTHVRVRTPIATTLHVDYGVSPEFGLSVSSESSGVDHDVLLDGLKPETRYYYRVRAHAGPVEALSITNEFRTMATSGGIRFQVVANTGSGSAMERRLVSQMQRRSADFVVHCGDSMYPYFSPGRADDRLLSVFGQRMGSVYFYFAVGESDIPGGDAGRFLRSFSMPTNGWDAAELWAAESTLPDAYYSFDDGDVHIVCLYLPGQPHYRLTPESLQYKWLEKDLAATRKPWKILFGNVAVHGGADSILEEQRAEQGDPVGNADLESILLPLASRFGVAAVFTGNTSGYERFSPVGGVFGISTGGGGAPLEDPVSDAQRSTLFLPKHHFLDVAIEGEVMKVQAVNADGQVLDEFEVARARTQMAPVLAAWAEPVLPFECRYERDAIAEAGVPWSPRWAIQEAVAPPLESVSGLTANLGRLYMAWNSTNLCLGMDRLMLPPDSDIGIFIELPRRTGITRMTEVCESPSQPASNSVAGLEALPQLSFRNFLPSIALLLGDPSAQATDREFQRHEASIATGQGAFWLATNFPTLPRVHLQQQHEVFADVPQSPYRSADAIEVSLPVAALGGLQAGDILRVGIVALGPIDSTARMIRSIDTGYIGTALHGGGLEPTVLEGIEVRLSPDLDSDADGLADREEVLLATNPNAADTDGDGLPDGWEMMHGLNPLSASGLSGSFGDPDGDCLSNRQELSAGTYPDRWEPPPLEVRMVSPDSVELTWIQCSGGVIQLLSAEHAEGPYTVLDDVSMTDDGVFVHTSIPLDAALRFFRLSGSPKASAVSSDHQP